ncbi:MAG: NAD-dependent epimerase/dehydratase family protein [Verrucomicrobia bacterium]|nr:NAD-dependent epimerase/dehydratase family protein [Verrucomicrobiota bacterium]
MTRGASSVKRQASNRPKTLHALVTGGAGFIGSNLCAEVLARGWRVTAVDNFHLGRPEFIAPLRRNPRFKFIQADLLDLLRVKRLVRGCDVVFHMAANSDISRGARETHLDLSLGTLTTYNVLEAMRLGGIRDIVFASTSAVYGLARVKPTPEDYGPLRPISLYGASKLAAEGFITAFCHNFGLRAWIYRFANIVGHNGTHGALVDFIARLRRNPHRLRILGDGRQAKPYLHVSECVSGMIYGYEHARGEVNCFNLAPRGGATTVKHIARTIVRALGLMGVEFVFTGGEQGWRGDVPQVRLDARKLAGLGWRAALTSDEAVERAAHELAGQL